MNKKLWRLWFAVCAFFEPKEIGASIKFNTRIGKTYGDGEPKRCMCGCNKFKSVNEFYITMGQILEYDYICKDCRALAGQWSAGFWIP